MRPSFAWALSLVACIVAACGGETTGAGSSQSVTGSIAGRPVTPTTDGVGLSGVEEEPGGYVVSYAGVILTNLPSTCTILQHGGNPANASAVSITVSTLGAKSGVPTGTYPILMAGPGPVAPASQATAQYVVQNATCTATTDESATSGSITLTTVTPTLVAGSFDVDFPSGDHLAGSFSSPVCNAGINGMGQAQTGCTQY